LRRVIPAMSTRPAGAGRPAASSGDTASAGRSAVASGASAPGVRVGDSIGPQRRVDGVGCERLVRGEGGPEVGEPGCHRPSAGAGRRGADATIAWEPMESPLSRVSTAWAPGLARSARCPRFDRGMNRLATALACTLAVAGCKGTADLSLGSVGETMQYDQTAL